jgi:hypothetical protein
MKMESLAAEIPSWAPAQPKVVRTNHCVFFLRKARLCMARTPRTDCVAHFTPAFLGSNAIGG